MKITRKTQRIIRLQKAVFYLLLLAAIVMLAKLSVDYNRQYDWTANSRHTLSDTTVQLLATIEEPVSIQVFASPDYQYRDAIVDLLDRYQRHSEQLQISYIDPAFSPEQVRALNIEQQGEMVVSRGEQRQHVLDISEQSLTNALVSVSRAKQQWLVFIEGHGERSLFAQNNFSLSTWADQLKSKGFKLQSLNLVEQQDIPDNTAALVIASPTREWLPGEVQLVKDYINDGGNLLWLAEPYENKSLAPLAEALGFSFINGTVLDPTTAALLGIDDPRFVLISDYANHPVGMATASVSLLAETTAMEQLQQPEDSDWHYVELLNSQPDAWVESEDVNTQAVSTLTYDSGADVPGPVAVGLALSRPLEQESSREQRIAVIGDGDFASNSYIGNAANLELAMALANWLAQDDALIDIPVKTTIGSQLALSRTASLVIGFGFLLVVPLLLLASGLTIWWRRRRR